MSTLAKIFVVINFALAVAFLVFTLTVYSKRVKYNEVASKAEVDRKQSDNAARYMSANLMGVTIAPDQKVVFDEKVKKAIDDKLAENKKLAADKEAAERKASDNEASAKKLAVDLEMLQKKEADATNTAKAITDQKGVLLEQVTKMRAELEATREVVMKLKTDNVKLQMDTDEYKKQLVDAQNENNKLKVDMEDLHKDRKRIAEDLANAEFAVKDAIKQGYRPTMVAPVADVRTKLVDVRNTGHVAIGAGSDSGIKEGVIFTISRKDEYIGKVRVTTVWNDFAGGQIIEQKKPMMPGDDAMSSRS